MQRVIIINLNGNAYQLDEDAYAALHAYLETAGAQLAANPDQTEIIADLEQAIAEKSARFLGPHKSVVRLVEIEQVLKEMGPVEGAPAADGAEATAGSATASHAKAEVGDALKRLYRIREGQMIGGVRAGLGRTSISIRPSSESPLLCFCC